ncbi:hypothetical protein SNEBB_008255 [Seison nebaliae]|nr:hypothetical protein SNEBB_008255 [Seison nebaliae]
MRPLTEEENKIMFEKLNHYIGDNMKQLIDRKDGTYCFRMHNDRVYYGKINKKSYDFLVHITALNYLAPYAKFKVWVKPAAEQQFLYGQHVLKSGMGRITENAIKYQGVIVYSMDDLPLGFGALAKSTSECRHADPTTIVCFHQADVGEYLRNEGEIF